MPQVRSALVAGVAVLAFDETAVDPAASILIGVLVVVSAWGLLRDTVNVLLEGAPRDLDLAEIEAARRRASRRGGPPPARVGARLGRARTVGARGARQRAEPARRSVGGCRPQGAACVALWDRARDGGAGVPRLPVGRGRAPRRGGAFGRWNAATALTPAPAPITSAIARRSSQGAIVVGTCECERLVTSASPPANKRNTPPINAIGARGRPPAERTPRAR